MIKKTTYRERRLDDQLHARGPVGLEELTAYKYTIRGTGQIR